MSTAFSPGLAARVHHGFSSARKPGIMACDRHLWGEQACRSRLEAESPRSSDILAPSFVQVNPLRYQRIRHLPPVDPSAPALSTAECWCAKVSLSTPRTLLTVLARRFAESLPELPELNKGMSGFSVRSKEIPPGLQQPPL